MKACDAKCIKGQFLHPPGVANVLDGYGMQPYVFVIHCLYILQEDVHVTLSEIIVFFHYLVPSPGVYFNRMLSSSSTMHELEGGGGLFNACIVVL